MPPGRSHSGDETATPTHTEIRRGEHLSQCATVAHLPHMPNASVACLSPWRQSGCNWHSTSWLATLGPAMASASASHLQMLITTKMLVDDLKSVCQKCGFSKTGLKKQLQQRVIDALAGRAVQSNTGGKTIVCRPEVVEAAVRDVYTSAHGPPRAMPPPGVQRATVPPSLVPSMGRATTVPPSVPAGPGGAGAVVNAGHAGPSSMVRIARSAQPLPVADKVMQGAYKASQGPFALDSLCLRAHRMPRHAGDRVLGTGRAGHSGHG
jgi:SAP domain